MTRRFALLPLAFVATLSLVLAACAAPPAAAPALTDPKDIVTKGVTSLPGVKSFEFTGTFSGTVSAGQMGTFDLSSIKMAGAVDVANKALKFNFDAPSLLGSKLDAIVVGDTAYYKVAGGIAAGLHGQADKYTKFPVESGSGSPVDMATDVAKLTTDITAALDKLPSPLTKGADERCGDLDCYHVSTVVTADQMKALSGGAASTLDGDITVDLWTRKLDYRPAKVGISIASTSVGTFGVTLDLRYDGSVSVQAPPADQVAP
jgi:hypothetical protein